MAKLLWAGKQSVEQQLSAPAVNLQTHEILGAPGWQEAQDGAAPWHNRLVHGDKRVVLPALQAEFASSVALIYIDPPFMTGRDFTSGQHFAYSDRWQNDLDLYLQWLYETLVHLHRLLAPRGSLYVHLDWRVAHYAKIMLDEVFGFSANADGPGFKSEIIWHYQSGGRSHKMYARKHDTLLLYTKSAQYCFHSERIGERRGDVKRNHMRKHTAADGRVAWSIRAGGRLYTYDEDTLLTPSDVWHDISHLHQRDPERNGYATQKPAALLERIILASSEVDDLVLDCFCGSGVTPAVAEQLGRRWIACDQSTLAIQRTRERLLAREQLRPCVVQQAGPATPRTLPI
jgi:site-specific DNA-methyltransferase (adenine-specific)